MQAGGLTVEAAGLTVKAVGLTVKAGGLTVEPLNKPPAIPKGEIRDG